MQPEILIKGLQEMQLPADSETLSRFEAFHSLLDEYNEKMDLTAVLEEEERIRRHYLDSVVFLRYFHPSRGDSLIDVGTGAGFPGIPLLLVRPDLKVTFLDAQQKRLSFIEEVLRRLHLQGETLHLRAEDEEISFVAQEDKGVTVVLDTNLTDALINEGYAREVVSKLQNMRKDAGFEVTDRIDVRYTCGDKLAAAVEAGRDMIMRGTLALTLERADADESFVSAAWNINGEDASLAVRVAK